MAEKIVEIDLADVRQAVIEKIIAADVNENPSPHLIVDQVFSSALYKVILKSWPDAGLFEKLTTMGRITYDAERFAILFNQEGVELLPPMQRGFWVQMWLHVINHPDVIRAFVERFESYSHKPYLGADAYYGDGLLVSDRTTYRIDPHTDLPHREVTVLYYMPKDDSLKHLGTSFYRPKEVGFECPKGSHHDASLFDEAARLEFLPNRMMAFIRTNTSFHGVEPITDVGVDRHLLIYNVRLRSAAKQAAE